MKDRIFGLIAPKQSCNMTYLAMAPFLNRFTPSGWVMFQIFPLSGNIKAANQANTRTLGVPDGNIKATLGYIKVTLGHTKTTSRHKCFT